MKVKIGKYPKFLSFPYHWEEWLEKKIGKEKAEKISELVQTFLNFVWNKRSYGSERKIKIRVDFSDIINADETMCLLILAVLKKYRECSHQYGTPTINPKDVPERLRLVPTTPGQQDVLRLAQWEYIQDEVIFAFESLVDDDWEFKSPRSPAYNKRVKRVENGLKLFTKYLRGYWL